MSLDGLQIFGTKKCADTRKAERFFRDRGVRFHFVDLGAKGAKGMSPGELRSVASRVGGMDALLDRAGKRYLDLGLQHRAPTGPRVEETLVADPLLIRTPIVRAPPARATIGYAADVWATWLK